MLLVQKFWMAVQNQLHRGREVLGVGAQDVDVGRRKRKRNLPIEPGCIDLVSIGAYQAERKRASILVVEVPDRLGRADASAPAGKRKGGDAWRLDRADGRMVATAKDADGNGHSTTPSSAATVSNACLRR